MDEEEAEALRSASPSPEVRRRLCLDPEGAASEVEGSAAEASDGGTRPPY